jgi:hypothetical protein
MKRRDFLKTTSAAGLLTWITPAGVVHKFTASPTAADLENSFLNPSNTARPGNIWFWMNGHVTKEGITMDLEAMARVGIGAVFNFDAGTGIPKGPLEYLSPEWFEMKVHALKECERLGIDFTMHNCPGWSSSGGPWITPELSMKTLTWSETSVASDTNATSLVLPTPPAKLDYYKDVAVLLFPSLPDNTPPFREWDKKTNKEFSRYGTEPIEKDLPAIPSGTVLNVTAYMNAGGVLDLKKVQAEMNKRKAEARKWTVIRFGFTSLGTLNRSAPDTGIGLECDKYDPKAIAFHFDKMMSNLLPVIKPLAQQGKMGLEIDSYEVGMQNWTAGFEQEFERRNGYSLLAYLPAMTGKVVDNAEVTERFLWDLRRTQADLLADNYYGKFHELCRAHNILSYVEPYDRGMMEELQIGSRADVVMGEYWNSLSTIFQNNLTMRRTCKLVSSIAHISGQKIVGVEGLTGEPEAARWQEYAFAMKPICDKIFLMGINRILIHRNAHQPHPTAAPGMTMGPWGIHFDRTNTLWETNKAWLAYLARCQSLLQQGLFVADFAYFTGEEAGVYTRVNPDELNPKPLEGYDYDVINAETLVKKARIEDSRLVLPDGMSYRVLVLQEQKAMSLELLKKVHEFIGQGLVVVGARPETTPGLKHHTGQSGREFARILDELWGSDQSLDAKIGKGRLLWGQALAQVCKTIGLLPDFEVHSRSGDAPIRYFHRKADATDFYFVCNQRRSTEELVCSFRVTGKKPELWNPNTGAILDAPVFEQADGQTHVALTLDPYGSVFVVFRDTILQSPLQSVRNDNTELLSVSRSQADPKPPYPEVANTFTVAFWAKPEYNAMLSTKAFYEGIKDPWTDFYAIYPTAGETLYGRNHGTSGVTVGRNGVAVWENVNGTPVFNVSAKTPLSGWNHIAVVYQDGVPSIFINGTFAAKGEKKVEFIHPGVGRTLLRDGASYYNGDMTAPTVLPTAVSAETLEKMVQTAPVIPAANPAVSLSSLKKTPLLFWENGNYILKAPNGNGKLVKLTQLASPKPLEGKWEVTFPEKSGAPAKLTLPRLMSLKDHANAGVKYFSGTATYRKSFSLSAKRLTSGKRVFLDLGRVEVVAEVILNGRNLGIYWLRPYLVDITEAAKAGSNTLEIHVTNQWVNRLIGDEQLPETDSYASGDESSPFAPLAIGAIRELPAWYRKGEPKPDNGRVAFTTWKHHHKDSPLLDAGLIGPVVIKEAMAVAL